MPEVASRHHLELVNAVVDDALAQGGAGLDDVELVAVTQGPGLVGALLVGVSDRQGARRRARLPLAPVDHLQGHVAANFLEPDPLRAAVPVPDRQRRPHAAGRVDAHDRFAVLGRTLDDAAGEAFDKGARLLGLGYPGGPALERLAPRATPPRSTSRSRLASPAWTSPSPA